MQVHIFNKRQAPSNPTPTLSNHALPLSFWYEVYVTRLYLLIEGDNSSYIF